MALTLPTMRRAFSGMVQFLNNRVNALEHKMYYTKVDLACERGRINDLKEKSIWQDKCIKKLEYKLFGDGGVQYDPSKEMVKVYEAVGKVQKQIEGVETTLALFDTEALELRLIALNEQVAAATDKMCEINMQVNAGAAWLAKLRRDPDALIGDMAAEEIKDSATSKPVTERLRAAPSFWSRLGFFK